MDSSTREVTRSLSALRSGDQEAAARLMDMVYEPLRAVAAQTFRQHPRAVTLQPTALVHEVFLRLVDRDVDWRDRAHFFAVCAKAMRGILANRARDAQALKRGGGARRVTLSGQPVADARDFDALVLEEALGRLEALSERQARVVECRFFAGMTIPEVAHALGVSERTVNSDWTMARAWLNAELAETE